MAPQVRMRLCSVLAVQADDRTLSGHDLGSRKARTLLAYLVSERGRMVPVDHVADIVWPTGAPADPAANIATLVSRLRRVIGDGLLAASGRAYGVVASACTVDLDEAAGFVDEGRSRLAADEPALAAAAARRALQLLGTQPALPDESDADWVLRVRREADELRRRARHVLVEAVTSTDSGEATEVAGAAVAADPYDERAVRDLIRALVADGSAAAALSTYDELAARLREDLGIDPAAETAQLHLAILREESIPFEEEAAPRSRPQRPALVGRESELATVNRLWAEAGGGVGHLVLVEGVGGIGKTRLLDAAADLADSSGGLVLRARCHPAERSLFLQPYVDALRAPLLALGAAELAELLREHAVSWVSLLPELATLVDVQPQPPASPAIARRRAYDAVAAVLGKLARRRPVLLALDDLQDGGAATVDLLGYLAGRLAGAGVLLLGAVRSEDESTVTRLGDRAIRIQLDSLPAAAVEALAAAAGLSAHANEVLARTAGHSLSVVESLRALAAGEAGVPESLAAAVQARVDRLQPPGRELVQGASVLHGRLDPRLLGDLVGLSELSAVRLSEELTTVGLLHRVGAHYEFVNDLTQQSVYLSLAPPLLAAYHRRAADLLSNQPESMAAHAYAAGEPGRAAQGWLLAGQAAMGRSAVEDAIGLFDRSIEAADDSLLRARVLLARARAREASTAYATALEDIDEALALARNGRDRRLEMAALRARGGDVPVALRLSSSAVAVHLEAGQQLASSLGDRAAEADFTTRLTVLETSRLRLASALRRAEAGLARARASSSQEAVPLALDGVKTVLGYLGEADRLREVLAELTPPLREQRSTWLLQWAVFESSYVAAADGSWDEARAIVDEALEINRHSGFRAYAGYFRAHLGWYERLAGNLDVAIARGRTAVAEASPVDHPWWYASAAGLLASTLIDAGSPGEAEVLARRGLTVAGPEAPEAWRLRCLAPLALIDGPNSESAHAEARRLVEAIECPPGKAWITGADCYLLVARAALRRDDAEGAARALAPLARAVELSWESVRVRVEEQVGQISSATS